MDMAAESSLRVILFEEVKDDEPVGDAVINGIMGDKDDGLIFIGRGLEFTFEPANILRCPMTIAHFHDRPFVHADETEAAVFKNETVIFPDPGKIRSSRLGPFGVVIARNDVAGDFKAIENFFGQTKLLARAEFGDIAGDDDEAQASE